MQEMVRIKKGVNKLKTTPQIQILIPKLTATEKENGGQSEKGGDALVNPS